MSFLQRVDDWFTRNEGRLVRICMVFVVLGAVWFVGRSAF